jgi:hypothetical protein
VQVCSFRTSKTFFRKKKRGTLKINGKPSITFDTTISAKKKSGKNVFLWGKVLAGAAEL